MKMIRFFLSIILLIPFLGYAQNIDFHPINKPGDLSQGVIIGHELGKNLIGPCYVSFFGNSLNLKKDEITDMPFNSGNNDLGQDILQVTYSGKIYSPDIVEPIQFTNKNANEMKMLKFLIMPKIWEKPYSLYIDLDLKTSSKAVSSNKSDDAGNYTGILNVKLSKNIE